MGESPMIDTRDSPKVRQIRQLGQSLILVKSGGGI
jgi:hypothetical protein